MDNNGNLPSGWTRENYNEKVLDKMYVTIYLEPKAAKMKDGKDREKLLTQIRPRGWVFDGYMAFMMYGPLAIDPKFQSHNMLNGLISLFIVHCIYFY